MNEVYYDLSGSISSTAHISHDTIWGIFCEHKEVSYLGQGNNALMHDFWDCSAIIALYNDIVMAYE